MDKAVQFVILAWDYIVSFNVFALAKYKNIIDK